MKVDTQNHIVFKLTLAEWALKHLPAFDPYYLKWKRHYLIQRLCALQIKEFNREDAE